MVVICLKSQVENGKVWTRTWSWGLCLRLSRDAKWQLCCASRLEPSTLTPIQLAASPSAVVQSGMSVALSHCAGTYRKGIQTLCLRVALSIEEHVFAQRYSQMAARAQKRENSSNRVKRTFEAGGI